MLILLTRRQLQTPDISRTWRIGSNYTLFPEKQLKSNTKFALTGKLPLLTIRFQKKPKKTYFSDFLKALYGAGHFLRKKMMKFKVKERFRGYFRLLFQDEIHKQFFFSFTTQGVMIIPFWICMWKVYIRRV